MKLSKHIFASVVAIICVISIAVTSFAVSPVATSTRMVKVDTKTVLQEDYAGIGDNYWTGPYAEGMNSAYQYINDKRTNTLKPAYMRMLLLPGWLVDFSLSSEEQESNWTNGIYNFDSVEFKNFARQIQMFKAAGTEICLNMGARSHYEMVEWFSIPNVAMTEMGTRSGPKDLEAFANATYAVIKELETNYGCDNIKYISFYNETNYGNFEAFFDKREYWCRMVLAVHNKLKAEGVRDNYKIFGTELAGFADDEKIYDFLEYVKANLVDEQGNKVYDYLNSHLYAWADDYDALLDRIKNHSDMYPGIWANEYSSFDRPVAITNDRRADYKFSELTNTIIHAMCGLGGSASWFYCGDTIPEPANSPHDNLLISMWMRPSNGTENVSVGYNVKGLPMRYVPKHSKIVETQIDSDDIIGATYIKGEDATVLLEIDYSDINRELTVDLGSEFNGKTFNRILYRFPDDIDDDGIADYREPTPDGDVLARVDKTIVCENGKLIDILPTGGHYAVVYTTLKEQVQVALKNDVLNVAKNGTVQIEIDKNMCGAISANETFTYEILGKYDAEEDTLKNGYAWSTSNAGTIVDNGNGTATFTADNGVNSGDAVVVKVIPNGNYGQVADGYGIAVINIG